MGFKLWRRYRPKHAKGATPPPPVTTVAVITMGYDPLDPHGDGTLRTGDPLFDTLASGNGLMMYRRVGDTDEWEVREFDAPDTPA